jgi:hypothetical protein
MPVGRLGPLHLRRDVCNGGRGMTWPSNTAAFGRRAALVLLLRASLAALGARSDARNGGGGVTWTAG